MIFYWKSSSLASCSYSIPRHDFQTFCNMLLLPILSLMGWQGNTFNSQQWFFSFKVAEPCACDVYLGLLFRPFLRGSQKSRFLSSNAEIPCTTEHKWTFLPPGPDHFTFFFLTCVNKTGRGEYYSQKQVNLWKCTNIRNPQYYCSRAMETIWCLSKHSPTTWCYKCLDDGSIWQAPKSSKLD